jgi:hypothetical protein
MYQTDFSLAREAKFFEKKKFQEEIAGALKTDLPRFIPHNIYSIYQKNGFQNFMDALKSVTSNLLKQGMQDYLINYE